MSKVVIYYFTGSGNSLAVSGDLAEILAAELVPMAAYQDQKTIKTDAGVIGFEFPIYDFNIRNYHHPEVSMSDMMRTASEKSQ